MDCTSEAWRRPISKTSRHLLITGRHHASPRHLPFSSPNTAQKCFHRRRETEGNETLGLVRAAGGDGFVLKSDVSKASDVQSIVQKTVEKFGRLSIAFNNAGVEGQLMPLIDQTEENWDYVTTST